MRPRSTSLLPLLLASLALGCAARSAARATPVLGCFRADRLLGDSLTTGRRAADSVWAYFQLAPSGYVARAMLGAHAARWAPSRWSIRGDTLDVGLYTDQTGWELFLIGPAVRGTYSGKVEYLDDILRSSLHIPSYMPIRVHSVACPSAPPT